VNSAGISLLSEKRFSYSLSHFPTSNDGFVFKHISIVVIMCKENREQLLARHD